WSLESQNPLPLSADTPFVGWRTCYAEVFRRMAERGSRVLLMGHGGGDPLRGSSPIFAGRLRRGGLSGLRGGARPAPDRPGAPLPRALSPPCAPPPRRAGADRALRWARGKREEVSPAWIDRGFARRTGRPSGSRSFAGSARREMYRNLIEVPWYWRLVNWHD